MIQLEKQQQQKAILTYGGGEKNVRKKERNKTTPGLLTANLEITPFRSFPFNATISFLFSFGCCCCCCFFEKLACMIVRQQISTRWTRHQICIHTSGRGSEGGGVVLPEELPALMLSCVLCKDLKSGESADKECLPSSLVA